MIPALERVDEQPERFMMVRFWSTIAVGLELPDLEPLRAAAVDAQAKLDGGNPRAVVAERQDMRVAAAALGVFTARQL